MSAIDETTARRRAIGLLVRASLTELSEPLTRIWPDHGGSDLKPAETGLVLLRGRAGGDGAPFNLGKAKSRDPCARAKVADRVIEVGAFAAEEAA